MNSLEVNDEEKERIRLQVEDMFKHGTEVTLGAGDEGRWVVSWIRLREHEYCIFLPLTIIEIKKLSRFRNLRFNSWSLFMNSFG